MVMKNEEDDTSRKQAPAGAGAGANPEQSRGSVIAFPVRGTPTGRPLQHGSGSSPDPRSPVCPSSSTPSTVITGNGYHAGSSASPNRPVTFDRRELDALLRLYGFKVASGEWRDYAIDMLKDRAVFSVFRRSSEMPLHCIEKIPALARKQGQWCVTGSDGRILKRGRDLETVLRILERRPKLKVV